MTTSEIIACTISWIAALIAITALIKIRCARRQPVQWETDGGVITFDRKLTKDEIDQFRTEWQRRYEARQKDEEQPDA